MGISFQCSACGKTLTAANILAGRKARCTRCDALLTVPQNDVSTASGKSSANASPVKELPPEEEAAAIVPPLIEPPAAPPKPKRKGAGVRPPMFPPTKPAHDEDLIDMTAMVDIVFFLLIFFLVTSMQAIEAVLPTPKPETSGKAQTAAQMLSDPNTVVIKIEADDLILVDDEAIYGDMALKRTLVELRDQLGGDPSVLVTGSPDASHGAAVRVLDACAMAKLAKVKLLVRTDDEDE